MSLVKLAADLDVVLIPADNLVSRDQLEVLQRLQDDAFSAATFRLSDGRRVVVYNPLHSPGRTRSNQAHELAHIILNHSLRTIEQVGGQTFLTCDIEQEEEADWLAGCLLLPRELLFREAKKGRSFADIARIHETSESMAKFRLNASGVLIQIGRMKSSRIAK